ncbi:glycosyltransferase [Aggregatimonas sangjinii]|uniref:Glycosyltransferase n=1 Tax=Aggregatimonas sangjinii TaxID=2583587 RepID=A0A5B7SY40_9FLAO|nr:glycosyltransferase [Aggregatimonas sangjinii]QCX01660.1 glycosyltransferase [Aggregatimonas sangjinii]
MSKKRKKICITINSLGPGGAEKQCLLLAKALSPYHSVTVVILNPGPLYRPRLTFIEEEQLNHVYLAKNPLKRPFGLMRFLKRQQIDIIFSFLPTDTLLSSICGKLAGVPLVFGGIRNSYMANAKFIALKLVNNYLLNYTIANNFAAYRSAIDFGFKKKVFVISNGIDIRPYVERKHVGVGPVHIISLGRLVPQKEYATALKCIAHLKGILDEGYSFTYTIVGQGPEKEKIMTDIKARELENQVKVVTDASDIYGMLDDSDVYLCTSSFEGVSNAIMEAMNCALPLVATDAGDNARLVLHQKNGFITPIHDAIALANFLKKLIQSPELRIQMGNASHTHLAKNFSFATFQKKYLKLIENSSSIQTRNGEVHYGETNVS